MGLFWLGVATRSDPRTRSWVFIVLGIIMAIDEALEQVGERRGTGFRFPTIRRVLASAFVGLIAVSLVL
jgi:hypothetical protein